MACEESQVETLYTAADRGDGSGTKEFNTKGATKLYFIRDVRDVTDGADPPTGTVIQGTVSNISSTTNDSSSTGCTFTDSTGLTDPVAEWDWGSAASRTIEAIVSKTTNPPITGNWSYAIDPDGLGFGGYTNFKNGNTAKIRATLFTSQTVYKLRIKFIESGTAANRIVNLHEVYDTKKEHGFQTSIGLEFFDQARSDWKSHTAFGTDMDPFFDGADAVVINTASNMPHKASGLLRLKYTNTGEVNFSLVVIKVDPCKA